MKKSILKTLLSLMILFGAVVAVQVFDADEVEAEVYRGKCGENVLWDFIPESGSLMIHGSGEMYEYYYLSDIPWSSFSQNIYKVSIKEGVTNISPGVFNNCINYVKKNTFWS